MLQFKLGAPGRCTIGHFQLPFSLCFKLTLSEKPLPHANKANFYHKGFALNLVFKSESEELGNGLFIRRNELMERFIDQQDQNDWNPIGTLCTIKKTTKTYNKVSLAS